MPNSIAISEKGSMYEYLIGSSYWMVCSMSLKPFLSILAVG
ncbi:hypothetical protein [Dulcicalothrix desertica]|nr:hypothetical protein [Dulcicalothrix desertica]